MLIFSSNVKREKYNFATSAVIVKNTVSFAASVANNLCTAALEEFLYLENKSTSYDKTPDVAKSF